MDHQKKGGLEMSKYAQRRKKRTKYYRKCYSTSNLKSLPHAIDPDDARQLIRAIKQKRDKALILMLLRTGMRIGELLGTKMTNINLKEQKIMIFVSGKNQIGRVAYFSDDAKVALKAWLRNREPKSEYLFFGQKGRPLSYTAARAIFNKCLRKARLAYRGYTLHCLRHTFASEALNAGMPLESLQILLGHSNIEVTRRYAKLTDKTLEKEYFRAMSIVERGEIYGSYRFDQ
jgi:integrase/recombinase XerD